MKCPLWGSVQAKAGAHRCRREQSKCVLQGVLNRVLEILGLFSVFEENRDG